MLGSASEVEATTVNPLLVEPTNTQRRLLEIIYEDHVRRGGWPIYQYVEALLYRELGHPDAGTVLRGCPWVPFASGLSAYGWLWVSDAHLNTPEPGDQVGLTVVGLSQVRDIRLRQEAETETTRFLWTLGFLAKRERDFDPSPTEVQTVAVTASEIQQALPPPRPGSPTTIEDLRRLGATLTHEPSTWRYVPRQSTDGSWAATLGPFIRAYDGVQGIADYADRLLRDISGPRQEPRAMPTSSLALPEAIDYLNAVWRSWAKEPLFLIPRVEAAAKLALECRSGDEFDARVSSLCAILDHLRIPGRHDHGKLFDLQTYLSTDVLGAGAVRAGESITDLRALFDLRAWRQHPGGDAEAKAALAMERLGLRLPTGAWGTAWQVVQGRVVEALNALREEVELLDGPA
jgi:hypothetical protein